MSKHWNLLAFVSCLTLQLLALPGHADENLFGYVRGAEPLPAKSWELYEVITVREGKGTGRYQAIDAVTELEYGVTDRFTTGVGVNLMSLDTAGIVIDGYLPKDEKFSLKPSGFETFVKYNFLTPALDDFGFATYLELEYLSVDPHSGQDKHTFSWDLMFLVQKYFLEGQLILVGNFGAESTYADRGEVADLPPGFDWPTFPEMELEPKLGAGISYRFIPNWFAGLETVYEAEYETEVGLERWSWFAGPNIHYGSEKFWGTLTWLPQIQGGGEKFPEQDDPDLHLVEKTEYEVRFKLGYNF